MNARKLRRDDTMKDVFELFAVVLLDIALLAGAAWLCVYHGWSPWWLALALYCVSRIDVEKLKSDDWRKRDEN